MASYTRLGSYLTVNELAADPFGKIHRGLTIAGSSYERHCLVRVFSEEMQNAGLASRAEEIVHNASLLVGTRGFGTNYQVEGGKAPHIACDYIAGRSLAEMIEKAKQEQIPLGVDHALSVIQGLAQALLTLDSKGLRHGALSPHSIWISFEGAAHIIDAPYASVLGSLISRCHIASASLARYRPATSSALHQDLFALGAILFELLTFEKLPSADQIPGALAAATLKAAQDDGPIPGEILELLKRLLLVGKAFESAGAFNAELESVLYDGDYSPTTFNMAFFMHTLFREENDHDLQAMKADQAADFSPFIVADTGQRSVLSQGPDRSVIIKWGVMGAAVILLLVGGLLWALKISHDDARKAQEELAKLQNAYLSNQQKLADLGSQEMSAARATQELADKAAKAKGEEKAKLEKELAEAKKKQEDIQKQKAEAIRAKQELDTRAAAISEKVQQPIQTPAPTPQPATPQPATPAPVQATPQPQQAQVPSVPTNNQPTYTEESAPVCTRRAGASFPRLAMVPFSVRNKEQAVVVRVQVDAQGRPTKAFVVRGVDALPSYNDAAREAALASSYSPATKDGKPVAGACTVEYKFLLK